MRLSPRKPARFSLRRREAGYAGLCAIVCGQQLSTASAAAIRNRLFAAFDPFHHDSVRRARTDKLKRLGLSAPKIKSIREIGKAVAQGRIDLTAVGEMDADAAHAALVALHGIGPWSADIYLLFCLGHSDAFPAGDLAVQEAARIAFGLRKRPDAKALAKLAEAWRPWRGVAAHLLWAYYHAVKKRDVVPVQSAGAAKKPAKKKREEEKIHKEIRQWLTSTARGSAPRSGTAKQLVVFLHGYGADGNDLIDIGRAWAGLLPDAAFVSPHAPRPCGQAPSGREWFPLTMRDPGERWRGVTMAAPAAQTFLDAELARARPAAFGAGAGRIFARHHDGAACRLAPRRRAGRDRRLFRPAGAAGQRRSRNFRGRDQEPAAGAAGTRRPGPADPDRRAFPRRARAWRPWRCRSSGTSRPASATASTRKACATAANFLLAALAGAEPACG